MVLTHRSKLERTPSGELIQPGLTEILKLAKKEAIDPAEIPLSCAAPPE